MFRKFPGPALGQVVHIKLSQYTEIVYILCSLADQHAILSNVIGSGMCNPGNKLEKQIAAALLPSRYHQTMKMAFSISQAAASTLFA